MVQSKVTKKSAKPAAKKAKALTQLQLYKETLRDLSLKDKALADIAWNIAYSNLKFTKKLLLPEEAIQRARAHLILKELSGIDQKLSKLTLSLIDNYTKEDDD